ncbi:hypothetical protein ART_2879 [Arthrobacter sp. PAMC 25486]|uniref:ABC transporter permease n=1 Tax=Arthrobacter sp. PAMC 25486 TaxID=1494608 RepID=UPI000535F928|nr:FtsX-like permease family protein [Arthrobacter sp. PAMC 25486]AIY02478.1 hypothetical protein ART_2879 [Arthrobacter sp. PAMC 25486]
MTATQGSALRGFRALARESFASMVAYKAASILSVIIVAGMCVIVLLTAGKSEGMRTALTESLDSAGARTLVFSSASGTPFDAQAIDALAGLGNVAELTAVGPANDVQAITYGTKLPVRSLYTDTPAELGLGTLPQEPTELSGSVLYLSEQAGKTIGAVDGTIAVETAAGTSYSAAVGLRVPDALAFLEPLAVVPRPLAEAGNATAVVVTASDAASVAALTKIVTGILVGDNPNDLRVSTSQQLADLAGLLSSQFGSFQKSMVAGAMALSAVLVAAIQAGLMMIKRKDYGRRRALGASRSLVMGLILGQAALVSTTGIILGTVGAVTFLAGTNSPVPGLGYLVAVGLLTLFTCLAASILPAIGAAWRDPIKELRVP